MRHFMSGGKRNYYGKGDVIVYRLNRDGQTPPGKSPVFGANVLMLIYGDAFWPTYTTGDNTGLIATDSMKNFIQRETLNFPGDDLESYGRFLAAKFLDTYPQAEGVQLTATEIPYRGAGEGSAAFAPAGPERATARIELRRSAVHRRDRRSALRNRRLPPAPARRQRLPRLRARPVHHAARYPQPPAAHVASTSTGCTPIPPPHTVTAPSRHRSAPWCIRPSRPSNRAASSRSSTRLGISCWQRSPSIAEVNLEANNRTWDTVAESGDTLGVFTDARPPFGCLGLTVKR